MTDKPIHVVRHNSQRIMTQADRAYDDIVQFKEQCHARREAARIQYAKEDAAWRKIAIAVWAVFALMLAYLKVF